MGKCLRRLLGARPFFSGLRDPQDVLSMAALSLGRWRLRRWRGFVRCGRSPRMGSNWPEHKEFRLVATGRRIDKSRKNASEERLGTTVVHSKRRRKKCFVVTNQCGSVLLSTVKQVRKNTIGICVAGSLPANDVREELGDRWRSFGFLARPNSIGSRCVPSDAAQQSSAERVLRSGQDLILGNASKVNDCLLNKKSRVVGGNFFWVAKTWTATCWTRPKPSWTS